MRIDPFDTFVELSTVLTGYTKADLLGTGVGAAYFDQTIAAAGEQTTNLLWTAAAAALHRAGTDIDTRERAVRRAILADDRLGPVATRVIGLWYLGAWSQLPRAWRDRFGANARDLDGVVSGAAYREGLVWRAMGTHPPGAKQPGFGSWALPPHFEEC